VTVGRRGPTFDHPGPAERLDRRGRSLIEHDATGCRQRSISIDRIIRSHHRVRTAGTLHRCRTTPSGERETDNCTVPHDTTVSLADGKC